MVVLMAGSLRTPSSKRDFLCIGRSHPGLASRISRPVISRPEQPHSARRGRSAQCLCSGPTGSGAGSGFGPPRPPVTTGGGDPHDGGPPRWHARLLTLALLAAWLAPRAAHAAAPPPSLNTLLEATPSAPGALGPPAARPSPPLSLGGAAEGTADDIETIRRLLRDAFKQQLHLSQRLRKLEPTTAPRDSLDDHFAARALKHRWRLLDEVQTPGGFKCHHLLEVAGGATNSAAHGLRSAAQLGPRVQSCIVGGGHGRASVIARTVAEARGLRLWQCQVRQVVRSVTLALMPVGGRFREIAQPLHAGQSARCMPPLLVHGQPQLKRLPCFFMAPRVILMLNGDQRTENAVPCAIHACSWTRLQLQTLQLRWLKRSVFLQTKGCSRLQGRAARRTLRHMALESQPGGNFHAAR